MKYEIGNTKNVDSGEWKKGKSLNANLNAVYREFEPDEFDLFEALKRYLTEKSWDVPYEERVRRRTEFEKGMENLLLESRYWDVIQLAKDALVAQGIEEAKDIALTTPAAAVAFAEAVNFSAKVFNENMYALKPAAIIAAWKLGAKFGIGEDDAYYLFDPYVGTASFHNPRFEIEHLVEDVLGERVPEWMYEWSGVSRQEDSFQVLRDFKSGEGVVPSLRDATTPVYLSRPSSEGEILKKRVTENEPVLYSAHFVDDAELLKRQFPPVHPNEYYDHCTLEFQPKYGRTGVCVGEKTELQIIGRVTDDKVDALLVSDPKSKNKNPHITLSTAEGVKPSRSNESIMYAMEEETVQKALGVVRVTEGYDNGKTVILEKEYRDEE